MACHQLLQLVVACYYLRQVSEVNGGDNVFVRCVSVCVCAQRPVNGSQMPIAQKRLKLRTSNLTQVFPGTVQTDPRKFIQKGAWPWSRDPLNFWALNANNSKAIKATDFKFDMHVSRCSPNMTP